MLQERACSVFELAEGNLQTFVLRRQEKIRADITAFDFFGTGSQQLYVQFDDDSKPEFWELSSGGQIQKLKLIEEDSESVNSSIAELISKVENSIAKVKAKLILVENLIKSTVFLIVGPTEGTFYSLVRA